ncbi:MAG: hypothetical protein HY717_23040 [Planctomycetes bacterium]|nr:hypothetical protein [Planctomycetota bacterium]
MPEESATEILKGRESCSCAFPNESENIFTDLNFSKFYGPSRPEKSPNPQGATKFDKPRRRRKNPLGD